ncbi:hypothetical protein [Ruminococcus sp. SR1/5]|uniref:hypothetical protein n=1 Tax=Ruminococcus sp. SR1/5 TaxID=657323 RepID=UPI0001CD4856|nr:hypothetical protein [Ruminococcus sp. SR1/5]CBL20530.1 hypothetical protein CK1_26030 [Ruminococcus sp. SR1/5]
MNELKLEFQLETTEIPAELDKVLVSFLKATIENYSPALFEKLYNKNSSILKKYTWATCLPGARFTQEKYYLTRSDLL